MVANLPRSVKMRDDIDEEDFDIRKLLGNLPKDESEKSGSNGLSESLESSILKKINKN